MKKVNLFIVGAAKCGTSSLLYYVNQHPEIYTSKVKEPHYFSTVKSSNINHYSVAKKDKHYHTRIIKSYNEYCRLFLNSESETYLSEASPSYLWDKNAAQNIFNYNPTAHIIILLRNPIHRAYSHFLMDYSRGNIKNNNFDEYLNSYQINFTKIWGGDNLNLELGFYFNQLKEYLTIFPKQFVKIIFFEDLISTPDNTVKELFNYLDIDSEISANYNAKNSNKDYDNKIIKSIQKIHSVKNLVRKFIPLNFRLKFQSIFTKEIVREEISDYAYNFLREAYLEDILSLSKLVNRNLVEYWQIKKEKS